MTSISLDKIGSPSSVPGFMVGHAELEDAPCGLSVVLCPRGAVGGVHVAGSAAGTRQMDGLLPGHVVEKVHGVLFTGGSSFGLAAAGGVQAWLEEKGFGIKAGPMVIPSVPAAVIFDLPLTGGKGRPGPELGLAACRSANGGEMPRGSVGCGKGATVGKLFGLERAMKGGLGGASARVGDLVVGAMVVLNCFGDVIDSKGSIIAGARDEKGDGFVDTEAWFLAGNQRGAFSPAENTTLGVITTNARLDKVQACKVSALAHHGLVRSISPVHTNFDGDLCVTLATGEVEADVNGLGMIAARLLQMSVYDAVSSASGLPGLPAGGELKPLAKKSI